MFTAWTQHTKTEEQKTKFQNAVFRSKHVLDRLKDLIKIDLENLEKTELSVKAFEIPNWHLRQAFYLGSKAAYNSIFKLIDLDNQEKPKNE